MTYVKEALYVKKVKNLGETKGKQGRKGLSPRIEKHQSASAANWSSIGGETVQTNNRVTYVMSYFKLLDSLCDHIKSMISKFWWRANKVKERIIELHGISCEEKKIWGSELWRSLALQCWQAIRLAVTT